jgi:hypothetical protein
MWRVGDRVQKAAGYKWPGVVVSVFETLGGKTRHRRRMHGAGSVGCAPYLLPGATCCGALTNDRSRLVSHWEVD